MTSGNHSTRRRQAPAAEGKANPPATRGQSPAPPVRGKGKGGSVRGAPAPAVAPAESLKRGRARTAYENHAAALRVQARKIESGELTISGRDPDEVRNMFLETAAKMEAGTYKKPRTPSVKETIGQWSAE